MSVESVNNSNNNAGFYAAAGAIAGAGAGTSVAYLTKPFLKDGAPTDTFIRKINENIENEQLKALPLSEEERTKARKGAKQVKKFDSEFESLLAKASSKEEFKNGYMKLIFDGVDEAKFSECKKSAEELCKLLKTFGVELDGTELDRIKNGKLEDLKAAVSVEFDELYSGQTIDEIRTDYQEVKTMAEQVERENGKMLFEACWDSNKGKFVHDSEKVSLDAFSAVKKAAKSIQGKYALIYGSIAAAVFGIGTYLLTMGGKKSAQEQKIDAQV